MEKLMQKENVYKESGSEGSSSDFKDVFGGPPRRFSMQEVRERYSFGESSSEEKPVFGEERRRRKGADFFDDIFKGSPRSRDRDRDRDRDSSVFGSSPGSMIMSPARPFSPKPLPLPSFLPASFSLPAKSSMGMDLPTFGSNNHGQHKVDGDSNGLSNSYSWSSFSRFSNEASRSLDDVIRNEVQPVRPLSEEAEDSPFNAIISDKEEIIENSNKDMRNVDSIGNQFHFSIYKWEGRGVPMLMPHVIGKNLKSKDSMKLEKSCSSNGRMESRSSSVRNQERAKGENKQEQNYVAEELYELSESRSESRPNDSVAFDTSVKENRVKLADGSNAGEKIEKEVPVKIIEKEVPVMIIEETKDKKARDPGGVRGDARDSKKAKEKGSKGPDLSNAKVEKPNLQGAVTNLGEAAGKKAAAATRKVKEFVQIFNQETDSKPKADAQGSQRRGNVDIDKKGNEEVSSNQEKVKEQVNLHNVEKKPDVSFKVVEDLKNNEAQRISPMRSLSSSRSSSRLRKSFSAGKVLEDLLMSQENLDDPLEDNFEVHELSDGNENVAQNESSEDTKAIDAKIRQWSFGKKGNIRSLLSTLQYVLWAESGWKAVPLVDLIETNSVKRAYQKALLRLHPDKLQQKGADFQHKYIAEKVFDILQEAWDHFNTCSSLGI